MHSPLPAPAPPDPDRGPSTPALAGPDAEPRPRRPDTLPDGAPSHLRKSPISDQSATTPAAPVTLPSLSDKKHEGLPPLSRSNSASGPQMPTRVDPISLASRLSEDQRLGGLPHVHPSPPPIAILSQPPSQSPSLSSSSLDRSTGPSPAPALQAAHHHHHHQQQQQQLHHHHQQQQQQQPPPPPPTPPMHMHATTAVAHPYAYDQHQHALDRRIY
ncbi:hypothetical protein K488DRAFT_72382, partial [Vararia minispora EC-137]